MRNYESKPKKHGLTLNFLEVVFNKNKLSLLKTEYSHDLFVKYKENPNFYIHKCENELYIWELCPTEESLPSFFQKTEVTFEEHTPIFKKIMEYAIVTYFKRENYQIKKRRYSSIWEVELKGEKPKRFGAFDVQPTLAFSLRNLYSISESRQIVALTIRKRGKPIFSGSEQELKSQLPDISGFTRNHKGEIVASKHNLSRFIEATGQKQDYDQYISEIESMSNGFEYLKKCPKRFTNIASDLHLPDELEISDFSLVNLSSTAFNIRQISKPTYCYYNERTQHGLYYDQCVSRLQPSTFHLFQNEKLNILVVSPNVYAQSVRGYVEVLKKKLKEIFHLYNVKFHLEIVKSSETYLKVLNRLDVLNYDLAIIVLSQQDKEKEIPESPYHLTKSKLLNQRLPTQDLTIEVIKKTNRYIENNIALNIYAKLGGTAWTIEKTEKSMSELIIGIGSTIDDSAERVIGFATIFDHNGTYLVGDCSQLCTMDEYTENLENYLATILNQAFYMKGLSEGSKLRLIFHLYKDAGEDHELTAIENALMHFKLYDIQYSLVHISYGHNFRIFNDQGKDWPDRGTFVQLSSYQALLHFGKRFVIPVQVRVDKRSLYTDLFEITKQVLHFAHLSQRTFMPTGQPVSIKYPKLMAKIVSELKNVPNWDYTILDRLNETPWFI